MKVVFSTENPGKLKEISQFAAPYDIEIVSPTQAGLKRVEVVETGSSYHENAALKIDAYQGQVAAKEFIICGDDSGIEIDALGGEPGLHTRRWLGHVMSDDEIIGYALGRLHGVPLERRTARFKSVVAFRIAGAAIAYTEGGLEGSIAENILSDAPDQSGFPFRKLFVVNGPPKTPLWKFEQLSEADRADMLSHREAAFKKLFEILTKK